MMVAHSFWWGPGWGFFGGLLALAFWILVIVVVISLARGRSSGRAPATISSALKLLEERYARGEISREEFLERRRVLTEEAESDSTEPIPPEA